MIRYKCSECGTDLESPTELQGKTDKCPVCGTSNHVPIHKTEPYIWGILIVGVITTGIAEFLEMAYPTSLEAKVRGYTLGAYLGIPLAMVAMYGFCLGAVSFISGAIRRKEKSFDGALFCWLFLLAGLFDVALLVLDLWMWNKLIILSKT